MRRFLYSAPQVSHITVLNEHVSDFAPIGMVEYWNIGILEYWVPGKCNIRLMVKFVLTIKLKMANILLKTNLPVFHYSINP
jgi:hypothetical protein